MLSIDSARVVLPGNLQFTLRPTPSALLQWAEVNAGITYTERVQGACSLTLLQWYASKHAASASIQQWRGAIEAGQMQIDGQPFTDPDARLPPNAVLVHRRPGWAEPEAPAFLDVLWWDAHIVVVHKPSGLQVGAGRVRGSAEGRVQGAATARCRVAAGAGKRGGPGQPLLGAARLPAGYSAARLVQPSLPGCWHRRRRCCRRGRSTSAAR